MSELYPIKFEPILKDKIWGGDSLAANYGKKAGKLKNIGESWEISGVAGDLSVVSNGFLAGNNIEEIIEVYMGDLIGDTVYEKFGNEFPLLIKLIEAKDDLSVQVHPDNTLAKERHNAYGKTEMWYILDCGKEAKIYTGFSRKMTKEEYLSAIENDKIAGLLNVERPEPGVTYFTPAGRIHAIGAGNVLAEIQQTSDITYRIYDWGRKGPDGKSRELHTELAVDAIDFEAFGKSGLKPLMAENKTENLVSCEFFDSNILRFNQVIEKDYNDIDSFVIYICTEGRFSIRWENKTEVITKGETLLLPATIRNLFLEPEPEASILEIYIKSVPTD